MEVFSDDTETPYDGGELTKALMQFSFGKLTVDEAKKKAAVAAKNWDASNELLCHKGLNWYAKQIIAKM